MFVLKQKKDPKSITQHKELRKEVQAKTKATRGGRNNANRKQKNNRNDHVDFLFILLICCIMLTDLCRLNHPCISGINLSLGCDPLNVMLNLVCWCFINNFCTYVYHSHWPIVFFLVKLLPGFGIREMLLS
jgi:hypothetical protein